MLDAWEGGKENVAEIRVRERDDVMLLLCRFSDVQKNKNVC